MDNPTKNLIPRSAVEYICRKETVSTNPNDFTHSEKFIRYLDHDAISSFGRWQWANGFNTALVAVKCDLDKIPTIDPQRWIPVAEALPDEGVAVLTQAQFRDDVKFAVSARIDFNYWTGWGTRDINITAWMPLPEPYKEGQDENIPEGTL